MREESGIMATALIVYASLTGNTEEIADILAEALEERGVKWIWKNVLQRKQAESIIMILMLSQLILTEQMATYLMKSSTSMKN